MLSSAQLSTTLHSLSLCLCQRGVTAYSNQRTTKCRCQSVTLARRITHKAAGDVESTQHNTAEWGWWGCLLLWGGGQQQHSWMHANDEAASLHTHSTPRTHTHTSDPHALLTHTPAVAAGLTGQTADVQQPPPAPPPPHTSMAHTISWPNSNPKHYHIIYLMHPKTPSAPLPQSRPPKPPSKNAACR